jgi:hypothetical protein
MCTFGVVILTTLLIGAASDAGAWATITVNSLADPGKPGICALRDAITAANTMTATNGCTAGKGHDTIQFSVTGTIKLTEILPEITDSNLTVNGPASPGITISGGDKVQVMQVASGATLNLNNLTISHGFSSGASGGIGNDNGGTLNVTNVIFSHNDAEIYAGAIGNGGTLTVTDSSFSGNTAGNAGTGGAMQNSGGSASVSNSTFTHNSGGGITSTGPLIVTNSTFSENIAGPGINNLSIMTVTNCTFSGNSPDIFVYGFASLKDNILAGHAADGNCHLLIGEITDLGYNISDDDSCGLTATGSLNNTDPMLDPAGLANDGGPTQTIALLMGSPAIDAIPLDSCTDQDGNTLTTDQRGFPRPDAGEAVCDIGAYEFQDFAGDPGKASCMGRSISALSHQYRSLNSAALALGFRNVKMLQNAIRAFCKG